MSWLAIWACVAVGVGMGAVGTAVGRWFERERREVAYERFYESMREKLGKAPSSRQGGP